MKGKSLYLVSACAILLLDGCTGNAKLQDSEMFKTKTGVVGVFRQSAFYCSEATPHYMHLGDSSVVVKPTWSNEQDNMFVMEHRPGTATLYSYSYNCGENENKFVLDTTSSNKGPSGIIVPEQGFCKVVISFVEGEKLFTHNDKLLEEQFEQNKVPMGAANIPYCDIVRVDGSLESFADRDSLLNEQFRAAIEASKSLSCEDIKPLVKIDRESDKVTWNMDSSRVLMVAFHDSPDAYEADRAITVDKEIWVVSDRELLQWFKANYREKRNWNLRLRELLGFSKDAPLTHFSAFWVSPKDLSRPAYSTDVTSDEMKCRFDDDIDESSLTAMDMWLRNWFDDTWDKRYGKRGRPWSRLGYTYDWGVKGKNRYGLSEFIIMQDAEITVHSTRDFDSFIKWLTERM